MQRTYFHYAKNLTYHWYLVRSLISSLISFSSSDLPSIDYHHDALNPSSISPREIIDRTNAIFAKRDIKPKQHLSEPRPGAVTLMERRAHADRCHHLPEELDDDMG